MYTDKVKLVNKETGSYHDFLIESDSLENLIAEALAFEASALEAGFAPFASKAPAGPAPAQATPTNGEAEVALDQAQPGQLAKRFRNAVIEVTPRQNGNAQVAFYGDDKKPPMNDYPYVQNTYKPTTWVKKFENIAPFTPEHFQVPARYAVVCDVEVRYGDKRSPQSGNLYRNVSAITPAPGIGMQEVTSFEAEPTPEPGDVPF